MVSNREIRRLFSLYAELLLLHEVDRRMSGLLSGAAYRLRNMSEEVINLKKPELLKLFKPEIASLIQELQSTATLAALDELIQLTPQGLFEMMRIKGLGGKKLSVLWKVAEIDTIDALLKACNNGKVRELPGFGAKTQENIINAIEAYRSQLDHFHFASVADTAYELITSLQDNFPKANVDLCGDIRRQTNTVAAIEIIITIPQKNFVSASLRKLLVIQSAKSNRTMAHTYDEIPVIIYHVPKRNFYLELFQKTGNAEHVKKIMAKIKPNKEFDSEEAIYKKAGNAFIVPEMRENNAEWTYKKPINDLVTVDDIKGVVHNHTTWSDGIDRLRDFVIACKNKGYEYTVISDHSKNAHYAGGLKEDKVLRQMAEIDKLNEELEPFRVFKSIECDILVTGELDYENKFLQLFDLVIVSVHQLLKMDEDRATKRLIKAIEHPSTTILGHMTGRQLLIRPGYPVNFKKVIDACAANNVIIEINANPYRLDVDWSQIPYALKKGVMISVNPDAHSIREIDNIRWGIASARKGGLTKDMTWNAMSLQQVEKWLKRKGKKIAVARS
jgi:DNA polymerase (family 10)